MEVKQVIKLKSLITEGKITSDVDRAAKKIGIKFKKKVIPGDTIVFELKLISPIRRGLVHMGGKGYVNGQVCIEADMLAQVVKDRE